MTKSAAEPSEDAGEGAACGEGSDEQADEGDAGKGNQDVHRLDNDGIILHYEIAGHTDDTHMILYQAESNTGQHTDDGTQKHYHPTLVKEDTADKPWPGTQILKRGDIVPLLDDEHGQGAEYIA